MCRCAPEPGHPCTGCTRARAEKTDRRFGGPAEASSTAKTPRSRPTPKVHEAFAGTSNLVALLPFRYNIRKGEGLNQIHCGSHRVFYPAYPARRTLTHRAIQSLANKTQDRWGGSSVGAAQGEHDAAVVLSRHRHQFSWDVVALQRFVQELR